MNLQPASKPAALPQKPFRRRCSGRPLPFRLGRYTLLDHIGRGGMADIYLARSQNDLGASRLVVIKEVLAELAESARFSEMLVAEAKLAARLGHTNVVKVEDLGREHGTLYIAMEYVEGLDLRELLRRCARQKVPLPVEFSLLVVIEILKGLDYAHRLRGEDGRPIGIVHRDVSPSNVLVSFSGEVKLCDFGIARANDTATEIAQSAIQGKAGYMSPEHARGDAIDARADLFAVGVILWEMLSGRRFYKAAEGERLIDVARKGVVAPLDPLGLPAEEALFAIVQKALAPNREDRYPTAAMMQSALEAYATEARMLASPIRFGEWLMSHFGEGVVANRRSRERALAALERGPAAKLTPIALPARASVAAARKSPTAHHDRPKARRKPKQAAATAQMVSAAPAAPAGSKGQGIAGAVLMLAATMVAVLLMLAIGSSPH